MKLSTLLEDAVVDPETARLADDIRANCIDFLVDVAQLRGRPLLVRGMSDAKSGRVEIRQDRRPRDTAPVIHRILDDYLLEKTGKRLRSAALFTTFDVKTAKEYGEPVYVFPVDGCRWFAAPNTPDAFITLSKELMARAIEERETCGFFNQLDIGGLSGSAYERNEREDAKEEGRRALFDELDGEGDPTKRRHIAMDLAAAVFDNLSRERFNAAAQDYFSARDGDALERWVRDIGDGMDILEGLDALEGALHGQPKDGVHIEVMISGPAVYVVTRADIENVLDILYKRN